MTCWLHLVTWKPVKRKPARGTKDKRAPPPVDEKVYEKRAVFLEGHKSSGWVSGDNNWQHQHGLDFDSGESAVSLTLIRWTYPLFAVHAPVSARFR